MSSIMYIALGIGINMLFERPALRASIKNKWKQMVAACRKTSEVNK